MLSGSRLAPVAPWVLHHHERFDGSGYPAGLSGEAIPVESRVLAVANAFDHLTAGTPGRPPMIVADAMLDLERARRAASSTRSRSRPSAPWWAAGRAGAGPAGLPEGRARDADLPRRWQSGAPAAGRRPASPRASWPRRPTGSRPRHPSWPACCSCSTTARPRPG